MYRVNCAGLLVQDNPDALVLAVLCDFGERPPEQVVGYIVRRLKELLSADEHRFREHMTMLEILSENRNLKAQLQQADPDTLLEWSDRIITAEKIDDVLH